MSKATSVYTIMVVLLAGGLWLILAMGSTLVPPTDLAGDWELTGSDGPEKMWIEQSGKFVNLKLNEWTQNLKIEKDAGQHPTDGTGVTLSNKGETVTFDWLNVADKCTVRFSGEKSGLYQARRLYKTFN